MAYTRDIPDANNLGLEDLVKMKDNFNLLDDNQIVEHNLAIASPANGYYVRWNNGLQVCWYRWNQHPNEGDGVAHTRQGNVTWTFPTSFLSTTSPFVQVSGEPDFYTGPGSEAGTSYGGISISPYATGGETSLHTRRQIRYYYVIYNGRLDIGSFAIGVWK